MPEIKLCSKCGSNQVGVHFHSDLCTYLVSVYCQNCGFNGPEFDAKQEAIDAWNKLHEYTEEDEITTSSTSYSYYSRWSIQPLEFIAANNLDFLRGNIIKYIMRYDAKNGLEDLKKARVYLDRLIAKEELKTENRQ